MFIEGLFARPFRQQFFDVLFRCHLGKNGADGLSNLPFGILRGGPFRCLFDALSRVSLFSVRVEFCMGAILFDRNLPR